MSTYVIGEIGQNHNGSVDVAKLLVDVVSRPIFDKLFSNELSIMNAVKLTKRDLKQELSQSQMEKAYSGANSFGKTYGEHRAFLELNDEQHFEVYKYAKEKGLEFVETLCAIGCLSVLKYFTPDRLKVASRDLTNLPLLEALAETKIPIIISTGMAGKEELDQAINVITRYHENLSILHCVSEYPTKYENVNLRTISYLKKNYPKFKIGYSDHTIGIATPLAAIGMGAEIIEKHITLDRGMKGTDQSGSLAIDGIYRMMRDIRNLDLSLGKEDIYVEPSVAAAREKLERSVATVRDLKKGDIIQETDLHLLSPGDGFKWSQKDAILGKALLVDIPANEIIYSKYID
ncbi:sialic acid synthase [Aequorivita sublithincola DSM 14238]|uniref:Sialic acid synthase n=1 Tax=Aequorivita sublithincola (strain DSM 14238 / LMG 21431 / ACAM 643 / 9-3) TaxID=746697 RepID=I3YZE6_AEQSU|nr:N-acetylneuraminate synthase family protein [Aequorivita sublithincola]AFL82364.1 sialic acid synthase [Aequorivita sublithincola DSM 14238]